MKEILIQNKNIPQTSPWTFVCQVPDLADLIRFLQNEITVSLAIAHDEPLVEQEDFDKKTSDEFLFTFAVMRGENLICKRVSFIPRNIDKLASGSSKTQLLKGHAFAQEKQRLQNTPGKNILSDRAAYLAMKGQCNFCQSTQDTRRCNACKVVFYCCKDHQKKDWSMHKVACKLSVGISAGRKADDIARENKFSKDDLMLNLAEAQLEIMSLKDAGFSPRDQLHGDAKVFKLTKRT